MKEKLEQLYEALKELHKRKVSTLSLEEKQLVDLFCYRAKVTSAYKQSKDGQYTVLCLSYYAKCLLQYYGIKTNTSTTLHIIEDVELDWEDLPSEPFSRLDIYTQAVQHFPRYSVHSVKGKVGIQYTQISYGKSREGVTSKEHPFLGTEVEYINPLINSTKDLEASSLAEVYLDVINHLVFKAALTPEVAVAIAHPNFAKLVSLYKEYITLPEYNIDAYHRSVEKLEYTDFSTEKIGFAHALAKRGLIGNTGGI